MELVLEEVIFESNHLKLTLKVMLDIELENWNQIIVERWLGTLDLMAVNSEYQFVAVIVQLIAD